VRAERSDAGQAAGRGYPSPRAASSAPRGSSGRRAPDPRTPPRAGSRHSGEFRRPTPSADDRRTGSSPAGRTRTAPASGSQLRGAFAVLGVFLLTLAAGAADSYIGLGLGMITLVALTAGAVLATLLVRRRDLLSVVVAPPLVFVAVALVNIGLAPSASLNLPTLATLLVRGFPAMAIATGAAVVMALFRLITRR
jgi:hypothetical protein